jgi:hypothetical protein
MSKSFVKRFSTSSRLACLELSQAGHNWPKASSTIFVGDKGGKNRRQKNRLKKIYPRTIFLGDVSWRSMDVAAINYAAAGK